MSINRLLRSERLAECAAELKDIRRHNETVMQARAERIRSLPPPRPLPPIEPPPVVLSVDAEPVEATPELPTAPAQPRQWWEDYCKWTLRTEADARDDTEPPEFDDPLGIYS